MPKEWLISTEWNKLHTSFPKDCNLLTSQTRRAEPTTGPEEGPRSAPSNVASRSAMTLSLHCQLCPQCGPCRLVSLVLRVQTGRWPHMVMWVCQNSFWEGRREFSWRCENSSPSLPLPSLSLSLSLVTLTCLHSGKKQAFEQDYLVQMLINACTCYADLFVGWGEARQSVSH